MSTSKFIPGSEEHDDEYNDDQTGWYIDALASRQQEIAEYLGCSVYCVGIYPGHTQLPKVMFIQPTRNIDKRTGKLEYLVVTDPVDIRAVLDILHRPYTPEEKQQLKRENDQLMDLARRGEL